MKWLATDDRKGIWRDCIFMRILGLYSVDIYYLYRLLLELGAVDLPRNTDVCHTDAPSRYPH